MENTTLTSIPSKIIDYIQPTDGNVQYFCVDCNTFDKKLPVVVTVGSNLSQGPNRLPSDSPSGIILFRPFVESNLNQWRSSLNKVFELYRGKNYIESWTPRAGPHVPLQLYSDPDIQVPVYYHMIMANVIPWITRSEYPWSVIRDMKSNIGRLIFDNSPYNRSPFEELDYLRGVLPLDTIWVGHGNFDVHDLFMDLVDHLDLEHWIFSNNLTHSTASLRLFTKHNKRKKVEMTDKDGLTLWLTPDRDYKCASIACKGDGRTHEKCAFYQEEVETDGGKVKKFYRYICMSCLEADPLVDIDTLPIYGRPKPNPSPVVMEQKSSMHRVTFEVAGIQADVVISAMELPEFIVKVVNAAGKVVQIDQEVR